MSRDFVPLTEKELERVIVVVDETGFTLAEDADPSDHGWLKVLTDGKTIEASDEAYFGNLATTMYSLLFDKTENEESVIYGAVYSAMKSIGRDDEIDQMLW